MSSRKDSNRWLKSLAMGTAAEDVVVGYLKSKFGWVTEFRLGPKSETGGPVMQGKNGKLILPDLEIDDEEQGIKFGVEVKAKNRPYEVYNDGRLYFTVDPKWEQYAEVARIKKWNYLFYIFVYNAKLYMYEHDEAEGKVWYDNKHGTGWSLIFLLDDVHSLDTEKEEGDDEELPK